ncbi:tryptophan synthase subunit alpha [Nakamurella sp.]|uniref:tryptophan synthase subunit alpha n=1 Tax=Nakamurella sp. TaxID=1869182 RepID=UPI003782F3F4
MTILSDMFAGLRAENRAALVGYLPAGYPDLAASKDLFAAIAEGGPAGGCDLVEVGLPFSDPVLDGPVIQHAAGQALANGFRVRDTFDIVGSVASRGGRAVVMTYFNPVLAYGVDAFARDLAAAGGAGVITPDLIVDEAGPWLEALHAHDLDPIFLVAPSSSVERIALTTAAGGGFVYAASVMGVTGARDQVSTAAPELVARCRTVTDLPIGVGLGVRTGDQARQIAEYADAVIVGSAFLGAYADGGREAARKLAGELAAGIRSADRTAATPRRDPSPARIN